MSWKDYQNKENEKAKYWTVAKRVMVVVGCTLVGLQGFKLIQKPLSKFATASEAGSSTPYSNIITDLSLDTLQNAPHEVKVYRNGTDWTLQLTFDENLQKFIYDKLRQYQVDWAGVSVIDAKTGAVKALVSYSSEEPDSENLSLRATFPAASIFKVVTAGAAVQEKHLRSDSVLTYGGDTRYVQKRFLERDQGRGMTLGDAFAHSTNGIFGKVGARYLGKDLLSEYATAFGFNQNMPFEFPVQKSSYKKIDDDIVTEGKTAAGLGSVTLSPLHGSLIAASVANQGVMMKPYSIEKIMDEDQATYFEAKPEIWKSPLTRESSAQIQKMMRMTVKNGTARKGFREYQRDSILSELDIGGKTGSLTGKDPMGKNEWFVGYANGGDNSLALGIVIVNKKFWKIKPSELAKSLIRYHFKGIKDSEPKAITSTSSQGGKKATL
jgi:peptidoglycan glycosyltransferase